MRSNYKKIGDHIRLVDVRNRKLETKKLLGINIDKYYMPSVANIVGTDLTAYKLVKKGQFACNRMHVGRDYRLPVALAESKDDFIVSPAYDVFEINDQNELLPEYLMMWFSRTEFDRNAWFYTDADVRGGLPWKSFCEMDVPVIRIDKQKKIVKEYDTIVNRIALNNQLIQKLEETAQAIYKHWFVDFEFPGEDGKAYKSNGGEMQYYTELESEIPKGWTVNRLSSFCDVKGGKRIPKGEELNDNKYGNPYIKVADMNKSKFLVINDKFQYVDDEVQKIIARYIVSKGDIIISIVGTIGLINIIDESLEKANLTENCMKITNLKKINADFIYHFLFSPVGQQVIKTRTVGGVQGKLPMYNIQTIPIIYPNEKVLPMFEKIIGGINSSLKNYASQKAKLSILKDLLLSKLATIEN